MKYIALIILALYSPFAHAHVLLTAPYSVTGPQGVVACSAPHMTATLPVAPSMAGGSINSITITYSLGTAAFTGASDTAFTIASCAPTYTLTLDLKAGGWLFVLNGCCQVASGTLTTPQIASALTAFIGPRTALINFADQFVASSLFSSTPMGTQPATW